MNSLQDFVNWKLTHADKTAEAEGYPLVLENCKTNKKMKQLLVYGNGDGVGDLDADGKYKIPVIQRGINLFDVKTYPFTNGQVIYYHSGSLGSVSGYGATKDYILCTDLQGKNISINHTKGANVGIAFYDELKSYMSGVRYANATSITVTVPLNAVYYRFSVDVNYIDEIQVQLGSTVTPYEPYVKPITTNVFLNESLKDGEYIDFRSKKVVRGLLDEAIECSLPKLTSKTTIIEVDTSILPSNMRGKYIKN